MITLTLTKTMFGRWKLHYIEGNKVTWIATLYTKSLALALQLKMYNTMRDMGERVQCLPNIEEIRDNIAKGDWS